MAYSQTFELSKNLNSFIYYKIASIFGRQPWRILSRRWNSLSIPVKTVENILVKSSSTVVIITL